MLQALQFIQEGVDGPLIGESLKVTSCLIDWVRLEGNSPDNERGYSSCDSGVQGISPGWVDQYHMALEGQSIDITIPNRHILSC